MGLGWTTVWTDSFKEKGAGGADLRVDDASYESLATTLGLRGSLTFDGWVPSLFLGWRHGADAGLVGPACCWRSRASWRPVTDWFKL